MDELIFFPNYLFLCGGNFNLSMFIQYLSMNEYLVLDDYFAMDKYLLMDEIIFMDA